MTTSKYCVNWGLCCDACRACRAINPVVVAPTVAAVGLAFFAYGFPVVGTCVGIGIPQILLLVLFALVSSGETYSLFFSQLMALASSLSAPLEPFLLLGGSLCYSGALYTRARGPWPLKFKISCWCKMSRPSHFTLH